jgi:hypothetical protein
VDEVRELTAFLRAGVEDLIFPYAVCAQSVMIIISIIFIEQFIKRPAGISFLLVCAVNTAPPQLINQSNSLVLSLVLCKNSSTIRIFLHNSMVERCSNHWAELLLFVFV